MVEFKKISYDVVRVGEEYMSDDFLVREPAGRQDHGRYRQRSRELTGAGRNSA